MPKRPLLVLALIPLALKMGYIGINLISPEHLTRMRPEATWLKYVLQIFSNNDSGWYERICGQGYSYPIEIGAENNLCFAFFPTYPLLGRVLHLCLGLSPRASLLLLSSLCSIALPLTLYKWMEARGYEKLSAYWSAILIMIFPHSYYFSMIYTESIFLLSGLWVLYFLEKKNWLLYTIASCLFMLTRVHAVCWIIPIYLLLSQKYGYHSKRTLLGLLPLAIPLMIYLSIFKIETGSFLFFKQVSEGHWKGSPGNPILGFYNSLTRGLQGEYFLLYNALYALIAIAVSLRYFSKKPYLPYLFLVLGTILLPMYEGAATSQARFISTAFPLFILLGMLVQKIGSTTYKYLFVGVLILLHFASFITWNLTLPWSY
jgi:hypothetical protein